MVFDIFAYLYVWLSRQRDVKATSWDAVLDAPRRFNQVMKSLLTLLVIIVKFDVFYSYESPMSAINMKFCYLHFYPSILRRRGNYEKVICLHFLFFSVCILLIIALMNEKENCIRNAFACIWSSYSELRLARIGLMALKGRRSRKWELKGPSRHLIKVIISWPTVTVETLVAIFITNNCNNVDRNQILLMNFNQLDDKQGILLR